MNHTQDCINASNENMANIAIYEQAWPNHCRHCNGWGYHRVPGDSVPYGSTWVSLPDGQEPCPDCMEQWKCPRCGTELDSDSENFVPCRECGWTEKDGGKPEPHECFCYVIEEPPPAYTEED